ncbi:MULTISPECIES: bifunctional tetrahydrofolate synthase/dihydrofolate synthase [Yersinia]|jgi:dihydrofolate synthase / folylpolyglutamate synthase|uniref:Dihydrofolate synthase/folylpolyglutamate synthase n=1 Tax=Yersinia intermedia TaxID=631 RepID=A0ABX6FEC6_YERIN|nr:MULTISPECIES: bifunctional tetrahydrofolate synthase/dihydrofolate synthase [Yersinia]AJJ20678.1 bifunctional FolC family protein [Yersinia intermedia]ARB84389.1 bifunctional tetrahydrofolate synthase/dihydrofolate synthase [Yersinia sp. FDAARGOS_228]AVL34164.1 bifunctional tetrahydrofolate synthase/dihydrofolate synthase [Yersinia intermedia]EEQ17156.1 Folylpolyglutamate synthase [Yersinia intermedia ATCC 29909]MCW8112700.1 bifunctional tetrahydrofolate synthase/dihydrofolate synthase [Yer
MKNHQIPKATSPLAAWLYYLERLHSQPIELGLERVKQVAERLDLLKPAPKVFTVAGTNGKGTTCCTLESILLAAGLRVGVYSSPHLLRYTERVRIQGQELSEAEHSHSFAQIEAGRAGISLTYFEFGTLSALQLFKQAKLDVVILEVGLGGRLDATNIVDSDVAAITSIAIDHTDWLGFDRESIGREKAGVFRAGKPAVVGEPDMPQSIADVAAQLGSQLYRRDDAWWFSQQAPFDQQRNSWDWQCGNHQWANLPLPNVPLANAATALAVLHYSGLPLSDEVIRQGLLAASLPGRFQVVSEQPLLILDVAHNPHAARYLTDRLARLPKHGKVRAVVGMLSDKDIGGTLACLSEQVDEWYCAPLEGPRGATAEQLAEHLVLSRQFSDVETAWRQAMQDAEPQDVVIVCGSFHTVAHVMAVLDL